MLIKCRGFQPKVGHEVFQAQGSQIIGDVELGDRSSVWFNVVIRGDVAPIRIGRESNIQDGTVIHGTFNKGSQPIGTNIGNRVTIGHLVMLHGCTIGDNTLIGMGSIIMDNAHIPANCIVAAGSLVTEGSRFEEGSLILGRPAKKVRDLKKEELEFLGESANNYLLYKSWY